MPLISIVIANYNYGRFLEDAIQSVIAQDMGDDIELIICDGGSTDNSVEIIKKYAAGLPPNTSREEFELQTSNSKLQTSNSQLQTLNSKLIAWWCSEKDGGQSAAFNKGFSHARGRFLTWLNADDILTHGALKSIARAIRRHPACEWFIGSCVWTDAELRIRRCFCAHRFSDLRANNGMLSVGGPSSFFTKRLLDGAGGIDETLHYKMDTDLWNRFYRNCGARYRRVRHNIFAYRQHEASKMSGADDYATERALENRRRAILESKTLDSRYSRHYGWGNRMRMLFSFSICDNLIALWRTLIWRGRSTVEIC